MAATDPGRAVRGEAARPASLPQHASYFSDILGGLYCRQDGESYPCLHNRQLWEAQQARAVMCKCSHAEQVHEAGGGFCSSVVCGCRYFRERVTA